jgi:hypothetical protein
MSKQFSEILENLSPEKQREVEAFATFLLATEKNAVAKKQPKFGSMKGTFKMSDDFNAPLDDFREYMS